jgi:subtilisin family serine protease
MYGAGTTPANPFGSGAAEAWAKGFTGSRQVYVGIIDEGLKTTHEDLVGNVWVNPWETVNGKDDDGNGYVDDINGWDFYNDDDSVYDNGSDEHGTHVAGTVGARGGNGIGVAGVDWNVTLISAKFLGRGGGTVSDAIAAIDYITGLKLRHGLNIVAINASWTGLVKSQELIDAINRGGDAGILFVAAAGNDGTDIDETPAYPAASRCNKRANNELRGWDCIISVANLRSDGTLQSDSNFGDSSVDLGAPGTAIVSTVPNGYASYSGTSMAAPHVTGAIALCASLDPSLTAKQLRAEVFSTVTPTSSLAGVTATGGRLDVGTLAQKCAPPPPTTVTAYLDDLDPGFRRFGRGWKQGASGYDGHHFYTKVRGAKRSAYASWKPALPAAGTYTVQVWVPAGHATSRKATYKIKTADGWVKRVRNQYKRRGSWVDLGKHRLTKAPLVQLANDTGEGGASGRQLAYDAVRFVPIGLAATAEGR